MGDESYERGFKYGRKIGMVIGGVVALISLSFAYIISQGIVYVD